MLNSSPIAGLEQPDCNSGGIASAMRQAEALRRRNRMRRDHGLAMIPLKIFREREAEHQIGALRRCAATQFAELNGWHLTRRGFTEATLARGGCHDGAYDYGRMPGPHELFDHCVYFREPRRPFRGIAIVTQPYGRTLETAREIAASLGLIVHAPPILTASWWLPGSTRFFVVTRPGVTQVQFLPDQIGGRS